MKTWLKVLAIGALAATLGACSKKSNKSNSIATTPTGLCATTTYNQYGQLVDANTGQLCTGSNTNTCSGYIWDPTQNRYEDSNGNPVNCNQSGYPGYPGYPGGSGYGGGCEQWNQQYAHTGYYYVPVVIGGQMVCLRHDLVGIGQGYNIPYDPYGGSYYACSWNDPYCGSGGYGGGYGGSGGCVNIGGTNWGSSYGLSGQVGICW